MSRITVGIDGSPEARAALQFAMEEGQLRGADVQVVLAYSPLPYLAEDVTLRHEEATELQAEELLRKEVEPIANAYPGVAVTTLAILGTAAQTLIAAAQGADLLVVGSRGRGGILRAAARFRQPAVRPPRPLPGRRCPPCRLT